MADPRDVVTLDPSAVIVVPTVARLECDDVADRYAVRIDPTIPGGCMIYSEYRGEWTANPWSARALVATLLAERDTLTTQVARLTTNATARERMLTARTDALRVCERERDAFTARLDREIAKQARLVAEARAHGAHDVADRLACGEATLLCLRDGEVVGG